MRSKITSTKVLALVLAVALVGSTVAYATAIDSNRTADQHTVSQDTSYLRVVHASPDAPSVDVVVDNEKVLSGVEFGTASDYLSLPAGTYNISILVSGTETAVFEDTVTLSPRSVTTVAASGEVSENASSTFEPVFYADDAFTPAENESAISVVHLSPDAPAVDVTAANGSVVLAENVTFRNGSDYVSVPAGNYTVEIRAASADNDGQVVETVDASLEGGTAYTAFALGYLDPEASPVDRPFEVLLTEDATFTVELPGADEPVDNGTTEPPTETPGTETTTPVTEVPGNETTTPVTEVPGNETSVPETTTQATGNETAVIVF
ncbi:DUF4397 domain-containing protein [Halorubellus litoreus]|uniref:DUF4397 domain-containing protein n=1 Tax=Halorubellus litoreus TaxID=755308 RepID=A0ABD5VGS5_9EURY